MRKLSSDEIRKEFLDYFRKRGHRVVASSPLVPKDDPTLLFTNAGMNQFKKVFLGVEKRDYTRATTVQKCLRAGGKHNDLEVVGHTGRHHTFFEMLGNFSFGDYFKEEAIVYAWELITEGFKIPKESLLITVFEKDEESYRIWADKIGVPEERIYRMGEKDNFWSMGDTGPCGPCTEIIIDRGEEAGCGKPECGIDCDCDRFLELWNLVFMEYNRSDDGTLSPLPAKSVDTGMGLERLASVLQNVTTNFDTDLFRPLIERVAELAQVEYRAEPKLDISLRVVADHLRSITFLVSDGVLPSNEGRGYVLRRIIRRAIRHGRFLGIEKPFLYRLIGEVVSLMRNAYPELAQGEEFISRVTLAEEKRFGSTLSYGIRKFEEIASELISRGEKVLPGELSFRLYDTYGLPLDFIKEMAAEKGLSVDEAGFEGEMKKQRERARASWQGEREMKGKEVYLSLKKKFGESKFLGYERTRCEGARIIAIIKKRKEVPSLSSGEEGEIFLDETPFYGESGGQVGDRGKLWSQDGVSEVVDAVYPVDGLISHLVKVSSGKLRVGSVVEAVVDEERRRRIAQNHTATHLLHAALRMRLGSHVKQAGSLVAPDRLRFDFTHFAPISSAELLNIEGLVNRFIREDIPLEVEILPYDEAVRKGAIALFEEKYGELVRLVRVPGVSAELCGGTHLKRTGEIGFFMIVSEESVASGVRRIEAVTGEEAVRRSASFRELVKEISALVKGEPRELVRQIEKLIETNKKYQKEIERLKLMAVGKSTEVAPREVAGIKVVAQFVPELEDSAMRNYSDTLRKRIKSGVVVLGSGRNGKAILLVAVTPDLLGRLHAGEIVRELAKIVDGRGGGKADLAQAGGKKPELISKALEESYRIIEEKLKESSGGRK
ncbi:MAG: alanine--tRNA ligase [Acidobacteria bacterium]|nr:alanine--tRNA ligase [Acidobacteriota bacterium]